MGLSKNQKLTVEIVDLNHLGFGVAKVDGMAVFVAGLVKGDVAQIVLIKVNASFAIGKCLSLVKSSPLRVEGRCTVAGCTACAYRGIGYETECEIKRQSVVSAFRKAGLPDVKIGELLHGERTCGYRNKAQYPVMKDKNGKIVIGFYAPKSHFVKEAAACPLSPAVFTEILEDLRAFFEAYGTSVYDEKTGKGLLRHIYLRRGEVSHEILLTLVINGEKLPDAEALVALLTGKYPEIVGILLNVNRENTNVILGEKYLPVYGRDHIVDTLCGVELELSAPAFYQVNHDTAEILYRKARELAAPSGNDCLLDLFCGVGSIGLSMADAVGELIGVEIVPEAVECAERNAHRAGIVNARFFAGDATDTERLLAPAEHALGRKITPDTVVLDPPRKGCDEKLLDYVARLSPKKIVYVSCNPETLARDVAHLAQNGYLPGEVTPVDMFPGTGHVESVVLMSRA
ncbi:MAG: 23S rRNA (uracil(1939)-C(5))-methyltransferase RlmD [Clostridia bacterium]|nr:23S rRNA (uracil(1939)-C(5))-methyltransferase RlmD [Clostridia bacterium]